MKTIGLIPARLNATRFPGKLLAKLHGKSVIWRTYAATRDTGLFNDVIVVSDDDCIIHEITHQGGKALKSAALHESGTDRIAEIAAALDADLIVNVQGDEPFVQKRPLELLLRLFRSESEQKVQVASLVQPLNNLSLVRDPDFVKVALDLNNNALFFSRSMIPYPRNTGTATTFYEHIGIYAFTREALLNFTRWQPTPLEMVEKIECLRFLEHGIPVRMAITDYMGIEIDTPEDLVRAELLIAEMGWD